MILLCSCFTACSQLCLLPRAIEPSFTRPTKFSLFFSRSSPSGLRPSSPSLLNWMAVLLRLAIDSRSKKGGTASFSAALGLAFLQRLMLGLKEKSSFLDFYSSSSLRLSFSLCSFCTSHSWFLVATSRVDPDVCADDFFDSTAFSFWVSSDFLSFSVFLSLSEWLMLVSLGFLQPFCSLGLPAGLSWRHSLSRVGLKVHSSESFSSRIISKAFLPDSSLLSYSVLHSWLKRWLRERTSSLASVLTRLPAACCPPSLTECEETERGDPFRGIWGLRTRLLELFLALEGASRREQFVLVCVGSLALASFSCRIWRILRELLEEGRAGGGGRRQSASLSLKSESSSQQRSSISEKLWWWLRLWLKSWLNSADPASCAKRLSQSISCGRGGLPLFWACLSASLLCSSSRYWSAFGEARAGGRALRIRYGKAYYIYFNEFLSQYSLISGCPHSDPQTAPPEEASSDPDASLPRL